MFFILFDVEDRTSRSKLTKKTGEKKKRRMKSSHRKAK